MSDAHGHDAGHGGKKSIIQTVGKVLGIILVLAIAFMVARPLISMMTNGINGTITDVANGLGGAGQSVGNLRQGFNAMTSSFVKLAFDVTIFLLIIFLIGKLITWLINSMKP